jgi:tagatose-1,6-bisphosphate aldolase
MIMDEPTAALGVPEQRRVFDLVRTLRDQGVPVLIISHNIQDVMQVSDRIVVMRRGLKVGELVTRDTDLNEVVSLIVGGHGGEPTTAPEAPNERGAPTVNSMSERSETRRAESLSTAERRAYRQLCDGSGRMLVIACDQRNAMRAVLAATPNDRAAISNAQLGEVKADLVRHLGNRAPSVLLDPQCALPRIVDEDVLARDVGLLVAMDASGWQTKPDSPMRYSAVIPGIDADAVRALGGTAAKMLVYMRPDLEDQDGHAVGLIRDLVADSRAHDLLLVVEILTYQLEDESDAEYEEKKPDLIRDAAALSISAGAKVLKLQYPGSAAACRAVTEAAAGAPWAVLSAGVDHATFLAQLRVALANGASGAIAGRSLWKDAVSLDPVERADRLEHLALPRLREVQALIGEVRT